MAPMPAISNISLMEEVAVEVGEAIKTTIIGTIIIIRIDITKMMRAREATIGVEGVAEGVVVVETTKMGSITNTTNIKVKTIKKIQIIKNLNK